jgi:soluble lytic murein transglycosylase-like protein
VASPVRTFRVEGTASDAVRVTRPASRAARDTYDDLVVKYAREQGLRPDLVRAVIQVESGYYPRAVSLKGALGLMQLMPGTAARLGVTHPFDPEQNIRGGTRYLRQLLDQFGNNEELALAAYNAGPGAVNRYGNKVPPYRETRDYVRKVRTRTSVGTASGATARPIYKTVEIVDGREVPRYSDTKPASGPYQVIGGLQ